MTEPAVGTTNAIVTRLPGLDVDASLCMTFRAFAKLLPGFRMRSGFQWLQNAWSEAIFADASQVRLSDTIAVEPEHLANMFSDLESEAGAITPDGARLLVELYDAGQLELNGKGRKPVPEAVQAYIASEAVLHAQTPATREARTAKAKALSHEAAAAQARLKNPASYPEAEFTWPLLDNLFWANHGKGAGELVIGGVLVSKTLTLHTSNTGKTRDFAVSFSWTSADGSPCYLTKESSFANNRRNDADRNWGLPE